MSHFLTRTGRNDQQCLRAAFRFLVLMLRRERCFQTSGTRYEAGRDSQGKISVGLRQHRARSCRSERALNTASTVHAPKRCTASAVRPRRRCAQADTGCLPGPPDQFPKSNRGKQRRGTISTPIARPPKALADQALYWYPIPVAGIAQLVEHLTCNQGVRGSIPRAGTTFQGLSRSLCYRLSYAVSELCPKTL